jgi:hypothetical protein
MKKVARTRDIKNSQRAKKHSTKLNMGTVGLSYQFSDILIPVRREETFKARSHRPDFSPPFDQPTERTPSPY